MFVYLHHQSMHTLLLTKNTEFMIHTVKINDGFPSGRKLLEELRRHRKAVEFENPTKNGVIPEGYITVDEFEKQAIQMVHKFCDEHGID